MSSYLLANANLLDPATGRETAGAVLVRDGRIADIAAGAAPGAPADAKRVDCAGRVLTPGLIDMRAFVGDADANARKTANESGARSAATDCAPPTACKRASPGCNGCVKYR